MQLVFEMIIQISAESGWNSDTLSLIDATSLDHFNEIVDSKFGNQHVVVCVKRSRQIASRQDMGC
jgi:hypothetical protein